MKFKAYGKVNLCLKIYKNKEQSKHELDSVFYLYKKLYDTVSIKKASHLSIVYKQGKQIIDLGDCLIRKSLAYLNKKFGIDINYEIVVTKRIPFGAGLGGGSSDAAVVINYLLRENWPIGLDLKDVAIQLGSDIPFFLSRYEIARVRKFGEHVNPIYDWKPNIQVDLTDVFCSTKTVFESLDADPEYVSRVDVDKFINNYLYKQHNNVVYNDLTKYIIQNYRQLQDVYKKYTSHSFFTGAGSSIVTIKE